MLTAQNQNKRRGHTRDSDCSSLRYLLTKSTMSITFDVGETAHFLLSMIGASPVAFSRTSTARQKKTRCPKFVLTCQTAQAHCTKRLVHGRSKPRSRGTPSIAIELLDGDWLQSAACANEPIGIEKCDSEQARSRSKVFRVTGIVVVVQRVCRTTLNSSAYYMNR